MSTFDAPAPGHPRHRRAGRIAGTLLHWLWLAVVALTVFAVWGFLLGPALADAIGLWPTRAVAVACIALLLWRRR